MSKSDLNSTQYSPIIVRKRLQKRDQIGQCRELCVVWGALRSSDVVRNKIDRGSGSPI